MRRVITIFIVLVINLVLQSTVLQYIRINSIIPNTALIIIISMSLLRGVLKALLPVLELEFFKIYFSAPHLDITPFLALLLDILPEGLTTTITEKIMLFLFSCAL